MTNYCLTLRVIVWIVWTLTIPSHLIANGEGDVTGGPCPLFPGLPTPLHCDQSAGASTSISMESSCLREKSNNESLSQTKHCRNRCNTSLHTMADFCSHCVQRPRGCDFENMTSECCQVWKFSDSVDLLVTCGRESYIEEEQSGGPPVDNTNSSSQGHYALFRRTEATAQSTSSPLTLYTQWFKSSSSRCAISFAVNMFGEGKRKLAASLQRQEDLELFRIWHAVGNLGTMWLRYEVPIGLIQEPFRVIFEAETFTGDSGHIALDDLTFQDCDPLHSNIYGDSWTQNCSTTEFQCSTQLCVNMNHVCDMEINCFEGDDESNIICSTYSESSRGRCDFEEAETCGWRNKAERGSLAGGSWVRASGKTPLPYDPIHDHTFSNASGHFMYAQLSHDESSGSALLESPPILPPPSHTYNSSSTLYQTCQLRFYYYMHGAHVNGLLIHILEQSPRCSTCGRTYKTYKRINPIGLYGVDAWIRTSIPLPYLSRRFVVQFEAVRGLRANGIIGIDDVSLSPTCYTSGADKNHLIDLESKEIELPYIHYSKNISMSFIFNTCSNSGRHGPTQHLCDVAYKDSGRNRVKVIGDGKMTGFQEWTVPETGIYSVTAIGAAGGTGLYSKVAGYGDFVTARFSLMKGEKILMLIGQKGEDACKHSDTNVLTSQFCRYGAGNTSVTSQGDSLSISRKLSNTTGGGAGGGGGATFIFKINGETNEFDPLIIAAGAGGKGTNPGPHDILSDGGLVLPGPGTSARTPEIGSGGGGGFVGNILYTQSGMSLVEGGMGGATCPQASALGWETSGGFGGGGGGCLSGGAGGGFTRGNVSALNEADMSGQGGSSYVHKNGTSIRTTPGSSGQNGVVEIKLIVDCPCEYFCNILSVTEFKYSCQCRPNEILDEDGIHCIGEAEIKGTLSPLVVALVAGGSLIFVIILIVIACLFVTIHRRMRYKAEKLLRLTSIDRRSFIQLQQVDTCSSNPRSEIRGLGGMITEYNPNYGLAGYKYDVLAGIPDITRDKIQIIKNIGQGAFGEVCEGILTEVVGEENNLRVAVKTLSSISTNQAELDFLMEAMIMSKFRHVNVVRLIGVSFEMHPRIIILELLEGGDLKTFLRESRPTHAKICKVTHEDLTSLALDVGNGCEYLEQQHFIHRDIAARNCLLTTKEPGRVCKIGDFGMARDIYREDYYRRGGQVMLPVKWMPPEAFLDGVFTSKTDVWSFGVLLWEIYSLGYIPYPGKDNQEVMHLVTAGGRLNPPQSCPASVVSLMSRCWQSDPDLRPDFSTITSILRDILQEPCMKDEAVPAFPQRLPDSSREMSMLGTSDRSLEMETRFDGEGGGDSGPPGSPNSSEPLLGRPIYFA